MKNIATLFHEHVLRAPSSPCLWINGAISSYAEVHERTVQLASRISALASDATVPVAIFASRSLGAYTGLLAALYAGRAYLPLNPRFPEDRNLYLLEASQADVIIVDERCAPLLRNLISRLQGKTILFAEQAEIPDWCASAPQNQYFALRDMGIEPRPRAPLEVEPTAAAYTLFTSGTTGLPKGVTITHGNVFSFVESIQHLVEIRSDDRCTQHFDLTFDGSVHDLWITWAAGAALYVFPENLALFGVRFVRENKITAWFSVPSTGTILQRHGHLKPGALKSLRYSFFGGEALPVSLARAWAAAAPHSKIMNFYGPTEATVSFLHFEVRPEQEFSSEVVPIGFVHAHHQSVLVDENLATITGDGMGELCVAGPQVANGYYKEPELSRKKFTELAGQKKGEIWYRTGDLAKWSNDFGYEYKGRVDRQIKLRGFRVELTEIENAIMKIAGSSEVAVLGLFSQASGGYIDVIAFVSGTTMTAQAILEASRKILPDYMVPERIVIQATLPLTSNGKIDFRALQAELDQLFADKF